VGSTEDLRNEMDEALVIKEGFASPDTWLSEQTPVSQLALMV
jgi:hypothetical protein